jgi:anti-sigma-K factor RskA
MPSSLRAHEEMRCDGVDPRRTFNVTRICIGSKQKPQRGSPTGQPTGPVIGSGKLTNM